MQFLRSVRPAAGGKFIPAWLQNWWGVIAALALVYLLGFSLITLLSGSDLNLGFISNLTAMPLSFFAGVTALRVAAGPYDRGLRQAWLLIGLALICYFLGDVIWFVIIEIQKVDEETLLYSQADWFYLALFPLMVWGLLILSGRGRPLTRNDQIKALLDLAVVSIATWMVVWYFVISPATADLDPDPVAQFVAFAYPLGDLALLFGVVFVVLRGTDTTTRSALGWLTLGALAFVVTDLVYIYLGLQGEYASGLSIDAGWLLAYWFFALAALRQAYHAKQVPTEQAVEPHRWTVALPFAAIVLGYGMMIYVARQLVVLEPGVLGILISVGLLTLAVLTRLMLTLRENQRLNEELRLFSAELEARVEQRTKELKQSQDALVASQKLASVGTMAAGIVHEVSNPLNTIITASEMLEAEASNQTPDPEQIRTYLPIITRSAWHAARVMQALRTFSRGSNPELKPFGLNEIVEDAFLLSGFQLKRSGVAHVSLQPDLAPNLPPVLCDRNQIAQVILNLLNNAHDAMPEGGAITVRTRLLLAGVSLQISDQGQGMTPEVLGKIFDPFYTTKDVGKGTGLGLSIVSGIIRAHNGEIHAYSDGPGRGSTFIVTLPIAKGVVPAA